MKFVDEVSFVVSSGNGGNGMVSFRREKHVPRGGPDGGNGGQGGSLVFEATTSRNTLVDYRFNKIYRAGNGQPGGKNQRTGRNGDDLVLLVPVGTQIHDDATGELLADLTSAGDRWSLEGGRGGRGNLHFKTSRMRTPRFAQDGEEGTTIKVRLELKLLADVGLIGFPNAGKSTLISRISAARPKVADYPFTTLVPNLGVVTIAPGDAFVVADIPGLVEGAAEGVGLGHTFLRHIDRCRLLVHLVPADAALESSPAELLATLDAELARYDAGLAERPQLVCLSKLDTVLPDDAERLLAELQEAAGRRVLGLSAVRGDGVDKLIRAMHKWVRAHEPSPPEGDDTA
jgi:GTP-binding protein